MLTCGFGMPCWWIVRKGTGRRVEQEGRQISKSVVRPKPRSANEGTLAGLVFVEEFFDARESIFDGFLDHLQDRRCLSLERFIIPLAFRRMND